MIRERRDEDLAPLCAILSSMPDAPRLLAGRQPREWLTENRADLSWVFDMAPVPVTPTRNVVGHVQMRALAVDEGSTWAELTGRPAGELMAVDRLFVRPDRFEHGIGRFLLKQSIGYIRGRDKVPVVALGTTSFDAAGLFERLGFRRVASEGPAAPLMVHSG